MHVDFGLLNGLISMGLPCNRRLRTLERLLIYALHGPCVEVIFTAVWELVENKNRHLFGLTSIWAFLIYGFSLLIIEKLYLFMKDSVKLPFRAFIYLLWSYGWEFSTGLFLRQFDACPWDYEPYFEGHFMGLITLEYAPLWYFANIFGEQVIIRSVLNMQWGSGVENVIDESEKSE